MTESEQVFDAFRFCVTKPDCGKCPWYDKCERNGNRHVSIPTDLALAVLRELAMQEKAQHPRVLTLEEVQTLRNNDVVWLEDKGKPRIIPGIVKSRHLFPHSVAMVTNFMRSDGCTVTAGDEDYGKRWRCWSVKPTDEQRTVKWE